MAEKKKDIKNKSEETQGQEKKPVPTAIAERVINSIITGLSLVTALAWNEAIQGVFNRFSNKPANITAKFIYAVILTAVIVTVTLQLNKLANKINKK